MKNVSCPNCDGMLGVPDKLGGLPIECPVCHLDFVPDTDKGSRKKEKSASKSPKSQKPTLRALPLPKTISKDSLKADVSSTKTVAKEHDPLMPPKKPRLNALAPEKPKGKQKPDPIEPVVTAVPPKQSTETNEPIPEVAVAEVNSSKTEKPAVAKIIKTEMIQPQLTVDGKLPELQLADEAKPKSNDSELKSNPVFVAILICFSLVSSGVMLFVASIQPSDSARRVLESRELIREFYEVRPDQQVAPYQRELREAQLANSRGDFRTEIQNYEKVMARFHAEDRNQFKGLTGSPTGDVELEEHVSVLLNEAKRRLKKGD